MSFCILHNTHYETSLCVSNNFNFNYSYNPYFTVVIFGDIRLVHMHLQYRQKSVRPQFNTISGDERDVEQGTLTVCSAIGVTGEEDKSIVYFLFTLMFPLQCGFSTYAWYLNK